MQFLIGMMVASALFIGCYTSYRYGQNNRQPKKKEEDREQVEKAKRLQEGFQEMMTYDVTTALKGKR